MSTRVVTPRELLLFLRRFDPTYERTRLDLWLRTGVIDASARTAAGQRRFDFADVLAARFALAALVFVRSASDVTALVSLMRLHLAGGVSGWEDGKERRWDDPPVQSSFVIVVQADPVLGPGMFEANWHHKKDLADTVREQTAKGKPFVVLPVYTFYQEVDAFFASLTKEED